LFKYSSIRKWCIPVEEPDIIHAKESTFKNIVALLIFSVYPPGKVQEEFGKNGFKNLVSESVANLSIS
jgi:hypothetical protein